jgi:hypothetical protein
MFLRTALRVFDSVLSMYPGPSRWAWLLAHIVFLIGFRNRAVVLLDWAGQYWNMQRYARIF